MNHFSAKPSAHCILRVTMLVSKDCTIRSLIYSADYSSVTLVHALRGNSYWFYRMVVSCFSNIE